MTYRSLVVYTLWAFLNAQSAVAAVVEESFSTPVPIPIGKSEKTYPVSVLVVRPDDHQRHALALLLHGRGVDAVENRRLGRADYPANARYLAQRGYAVLVPTRVGYGITGGPDIEYTGPCDHKDSLPALRAARGEMTAVLDAANRFSWADPTRTLVVGDSFGGLIALALGGRPAHSIRAVVNVSGGDGGDSLRHVDAPCDPTATATVFATLAAENAVPALFLYSTNDRFWGPEWPRRWFDAWQRAGGQGEFVPLPPDKNNGHFIFNRNAEAWHGPFDRYVKSRDLP